MIVTMKRFLALLSILCALLASGYEIPSEAVGVSELEKAQQNAKQAGQPVVLVVAIKTQPET